jgi:hypothetical protein
MDRINVNRNDKRLTTPRSAAIAGVISGGLFLVSFILIRIAFPDVPANMPAWVKDQAHVISIALQMVPFAGIAYLWFMGVARDRLGKREDQFFATVFLGSGLLYLAMTFVGTALGAGLLAIYAQDASILGSTIYSYNLVVINQIINIYSLRMAAVFMISAATMWIRTGVMVRWLAVLTYVLALLLLVASGLSLWSTIIFPLWMILVSVLIFIANYRHQRGEQAEASIE